MKAAHMFIAAPGVFHFGFASHPPLAARIRVLEPGRDGQFEAIVEE
jgi:Zn-dependent protease with chaperone function